MSEAAEAPSTPNAEWRKSFRAGLFAWPGLRRELEHACVAAGVKKRSIHARWRGWGVHVEIVLQGESASVRRLSRFVDDLTDHMRA